MSQQEDDLRALAKIMDFLRAVSIILVFAHLYWYCYEAIRLWGVNIGVVDRILMDCAGADGAFLSGYKGCERGAYHMVENSGIHGRRLCLFLP